jgi:hypothetical protein
MLAPASDQDFGFAEDVGDLDRGAHGLSRRLPPVILGTCSTDRAG